MTSATMSRPRIVSVAQSCADPARTVMTTLPRPSRWPTPIAVCAGGARSRIAALPRTGQRGMLETSASNHAVYKPRILAIANQKGGVGKTTTAVNLAAGLAALSVPVLLIDFDPQGNASTGFGIAAQDRGRGSYQLVDDGTPNDYETYRTKYEHLWLIPSGPDLVGAEVELAGKPRREFQ